MRMETILYMFCSVADIRTKWSTLRAQFFRELRGKKGKSGSGAIMKTSKWKFFKQMSFVQLPAESKGARLSTLVGAIMFFLLFVYICLYMSVIFVLFYQQERSWVLMTRGY